MLTHIEKNKGFKFPFTNKEVVMIANDTGITPFIGMINDEKRKHLKTYLFWGGYTFDSFKTYASSVDKAFYSKRLSGLYVGFSEAESQKRYVQDIMMEKASLIARVLQNGGIIMICGSVAMKTEVTKTLNHIVVSELNTFLSVFEAENQIKSDCY